MTQDEVVGLIRPGLDLEGRAANSVWADLGAGSGAFTMALATLLGPSARVFAVDRDSRSLRSLQRQDGEDAPFPGVETVHADFTGSVSLPPLDGIIMANSIHFHPDPCAVLLHAAMWLRPGGRFIIVEYDIEASNSWVPYPLSWNRLPAAAACAGLSNVRLLGTRPSRYHQSMYSAAAELTGAKSL